MISSRTISVLCVEISKPTFSMHVDARTNHRSWILFIRYCSGNSCWACWCALIHRTDNSNPEVSRYALTSLMIAHYFLLSHFQIFLNKSVRQPSILRWSTEGFFLYQQCPLYIYTLRATVEKTCPPKSGFRLLLIDPPKLHCVLLNIYFRYGGERLTKIKPMKYDELMVSYIYIIYRHI